MARGLEIVRTVADLRRHVQGWHGAGESVGVVPTMGALHAGHVALVDAALAQNDRVVATLFVNPTQFGPNEDLDRYPRREADDAAKLDAKGVDLLYAPPVGEMYPDGFATTVSVARLTEKFEGEARPGHFEGVATVVAKLLIQSQADRAYFGEKDYQQLVTVRRMARDLDIPCEIVGVPTVREADGLALSSRNEYLDAAQRKVAANLNRVLFETAEKLTAGSDVAALLKAGEAELLEAGFESVDYFALCDADDLTPLGTLDGRDAPARLLSTARLGPVRLLDNVKVG